MMIFDTHAHYDDEAFDQDRDTLLEGLREAGIGAVTNVAASLDSCKSTLALAKKYNWMYAALGVHPSETAELSEDGIEWIRQQCMDPKVKAVGEIGLDYYWEEPGHAIQKQWFEAQLDLARDCLLYTSPSPRDA